jgi:AraC family transcriptional regulator, regulatory protein of adaptative response / methylphosphotriester-DNA alkyltransferase methyltransferase
MAMREGTEERRAELYQEAVALIRRDYARPLRIEGVARELATSRRQLQRAFAKIGNTSFREVLAAVRMQHARNLLANQNVPIGRVAVSVGYHQPAQFAKSFRRHHGTPPTNFRRALAADDKVTVLTPREETSSSQFANAS